MESNKHRQKSLEIWGGVECSVVRIKNKVHDQLQLSGHEERLSDLELFSKLGVSVIRYPLLWEKFETAPNEFFSIHNQRFDILKKLGITPIAGLVHHGSGPMYTDLLDANFPQLLAVYAGKIAKKYPWLTYYTPINEPLTTARFSGLYGIWYPHSRDDYSFTRIFVNEMKGIVMAMAEIRKINPHARLIQTEDLCKVHSTPKLQYQADFENQRRWLTYDFLTGRFDRNHSLWKYFVTSGISEKELDFFSENVTEPYIAGYNYYVTSERYLDERKSIFPRRYVGGNEVQSYADLEVVRMQGRKPIGFYGLLKECWQRYHLPMALTEVHLGCTREEQLRWFNEAYNTGIELQSENIDFRAITAWSFLGSFDWDSLLCRKGKYESGIFDLRSGTPRPTALASMIESLQKNKEYHHSLLQVPGWWKRDIRVLFSDKDSNKAPADRTQDMEKYSLVSPLLITGGNGSLGRAFAYYCRIRGIPYKILDRITADITSREAMERIVKNYEPWAIINAAGFSNIDEAEHKAQQCFLDNTVGASMLAEIAKYYNIRLVTFSSDQVFNGEKRNPYKEGDSTHPLNKFGESKQLAEKQVMKYNPKSLIIRSGSFFNPWHDGDSLGTILRTSTETQNQHYYLPSDIITSPAYIPDLVQVALDLLIDEASGILHLSNQEEISYFNFTRMALQLAGLNEQCILSVNSTNLNRAAKRPSYSVLKSSHGISLPPLRNALDRYIQEFNGQQKILNKPSK